MVTNSSLRKINCGTAEYGSWRLRTSAEELEGNKYKLGFTLEDTKQTIKRVFRPFLPGSTQVVVWETFSVMVEGRGDAEVERILTVVEEKYLEEKIGDSVHNHVKVQLINNTRYILRRFFREHGLLEE